ncbi:hypothetical protein SDC9_131977 [bioreactor metagenome]|uniref:Uncharacterized protein n=1 Tax=bioreactor metagenome TaxID=1076179 RepID=A0A645D6L8_9ZZZZ
MDVQQSPEKGTGLRKPAACRKVIQILDGEKGNDVRSRETDTRFDLIQSKTGFAHFDRFDHGKAFTDRSTHRVDEPQIKFREFLFQLLVSQISSLVGAGKLGGKGNIDARFPGFGRFPETGKEFFQGYLARFRVTAASDHFIDFIGLDFDHIFVFAGIQQRGQREDFHIILLQIGIGQITSTIGKYFH